MVINNTASTLTGAKAKTAIYNLDGTLQSTHTDTVTAGSEPQQKHRRSLSDFSFHYYSFISSLFNYLIFIHHHSFFFFFFFFFCLILLFIYLYYILFNFIHNGFCFFFFFFIFL